MVYPEAPFQPGPHHRVVRHEDFLQCLACTRWTGKVRGEYNFAYLTRQSCRKLKKRKQKKRRTGFGTVEVRSTDPAVSAPPGGASGSAAAADTSGRVLGYRHTTGGATGSTDAPPAGEFGQPAPRRIWPIFRRCHIEPD
eukprot:6484040-Amphidinium_carterae.1